MRPVSLIIADDHPVVLQGLIALLGKHKGFKLIVSCSDGAECVKAIRRFLPDLALLDMNMPHLNGLQVLKAVTAERLSTRIVFLAATPNDREIVAAVAGGAFGIMLKESAPDTLINCLQAVAAGHPWLPAELVDGALERTRKAHTQYASVDGALTQREQEVMLLVADGLSNRDVGRRLNVSEGTVKVHLHSIYQKVAVNNRTALAKFAGLYRDRMSAAGLGGGSD
jgi:two-component system, NarL family, nitrate/nitrite response regulator NarL